MSLNNKNYAPIQTITIKATEDIPAFRFVDFAGALCSDGLKSLGATDNLCNEGDFAAVTTIGIVLVEASGSIGLGSDVKSDIDGKAANASTGEYVNGHSLDDGVAGDLIRVLLTT
jgi:hypothetical protein